MNKLILWLLFEATCFFVRPVQGCSSLDLRGGCGLLRLLHPATQGPAGSSEASAGAGQSGESWCGRQGLTTREPGEVLSLWVVPVSASWQDQHHLQWWGPGFLVRFCFCSMVSVWGWSFLYPSLHSLFPTGLYLLPAVPVPAFFIF